MKRRLLTFVVFLFASMPAFAHATIADWLDKLEGLSGPGPFHGYSVSVDYLCLEVPWLGQLTEDAGPSTLVRDLFKYEAKLSKATFDTTIMEFLQRAKRFPKPSSFQRDKDVKESLDQPPNADTDLWNELRASTIINPTATVEAVSYFALRAKIQDREQKLDTGMPLADTDVFPNHLWTFSCRGDLRRSRLNFGAFAGYYVTDKLPSEYEYTARQKTLSSEIDAYQYGATFGGVPPLPAWMPSTARRVIFHSLDIGASVGAIEFHSQPTETAEGAQRRFEDPFRVWFSEARLTFRPATAIRCLSAWSGHWTVWDLFQAEVLYRRIGSVNSQQFGAVNSIESGVHHNLSFRIGFSYKINLSPGAERMLREALK
jgi:hypothetical protein